MGLGEFFDRIINGPVGNNFDNEDEDVRQVRRGLEEAGYFNEGEKEREDSGRELGIITRNLDAGIRRFQRDNGLKEDGYLKPGGETESALAKRLNEKREQGVRNLRERLNSSRRREAPAEKTERPNPLRVNEEEIFRQYMLAQTEPKEKELSSRKKEEISGEDIPPEYDATGRMIRPAEPTPKPERKPLKKPPRPFKKPNKAFEKKLLDFIGQLESSDNYNVIVGGEEKPLTRMTVKQVRELQRNRKNQGLGSAMGRYQIIDANLDYLIKRMNLDGRELFDEAMQDRMGRALLRRRGLEKYRIGQISREEFIQNLADEWAALPPDESNESRWKGTGNNKALTDYETVKKLLEE